MEMITARMTELNKNEILMYLGHRGQPITEEIQHQIDRCMKQVKDCAAPRLVYRQVPLTDCAAADFPMEGADIRTLLKACDEAVYCGATLGTKVEQLLIRTEVTNMSDALIMDSCASVAIENVIDNFEKDLRAVLEKRGRYLTSRYSPGYGDLPLAHQADWCKSLDAERRIGLHVTADSIMIPRKSVTAVMGISDVPQTLRASGCESCSMFLNCAFRKEGKSCNE